MNEKALPTEVAEKLQEMTTEQREAVDKLYLSRRKSVLLAYVLWILVGGLCGHRMYLGHKFGNMLLRVALGGVFTFLLDAFILWKVVHNRNVEIYGQLIDEVLEKTKKRSARQVA